MCTLRHNNKVWRNAQNYGMLACIIVNRDADVAGVAGEGEGEGEGREGREGRKGRKGREVFSCRTECNVINKRTQLVQSRSGGSTVEHSTPALKNQRPMPT